MIDGREVVTKGITIRVGAKSEGAVLFDTNTLRYAAGWTGGFLDLTRTHMVQAKGTACAFVGGLVQWGSSNGPGWAHKGSFDEVRKGDHDPLPREHAHYKGMYVHGDSVALKYTVGTTEVTESPQAWENEHGLVFRRVMWIGAGQDELSHVACDLDGEVEEIHPSAIVTKSNSGRMIVRIQSGEVSAKLEVQGGRAILRIPARDKGTIVFLSIGCAKADGKMTVHNMDDGAPKDSVAPPMLCKGGPARWGKTIEVKGKLDNEAGAYVVDTIPLPDANPWEAWLRATAFDFFSDGKRAAVSTWNGDVWIVSGIDDGLDKLRWRRFASGLFEGLGLRIVNDQVYVLEPRPDHAAARSQWRRGGRFLRELQQRLSGPSDLPRLCIGPADGFEGELLLHAHWAIVCRPRRDITAACCECQRMAARPK